VDLAAQQVSACQIQRGHGNTAELEVSDKTALGAEPGDWLQI